MRNNQDRLGQPLPPENHGAAAVTGLSYAVPTEFVELPSRGKFYSEGHPLHNQETVEIKYMTAKEEDILASVALLKKGLVIDRLLENILVEDIDSSTILVGDRSAIMVAARISAYGNAYSANVVCNNCQESQVFDFDLKKINLNENCFDTEFLQRNRASFDDKKGVFNIQLPASDATLGVRMLTGADEKVVIEDDENIITSALSRFIVSVDGNEDTQFVAQFVDSMLAADSRYLRIILPNVTPTADLKQEFVCNKCEQSETREVSLTAEFFWPR